MRELAQSMYMKQHLTALKRQKRGCYFFPPSASRNYIYLYSPNPKCDLECLHTRKKPHSPSQVESTLKWFKCLLRDR